MAPVLRIIGASANTFGYARDYTFWVVVVGGIPATLSMALSHLLRSAGHGRKASFGLSMGGILNIGLDPLFMFVLLPKGNEVTGAAVATPLTICNFHMCYTLQAMGKGKESLLLSVCRQGIFNIPLLFFMNYQFGLYGIVWTQFLADALTVILSAFIYKRVMSSIE